MHAATLDDEGSSTHPSTAVPPASQVHAATLDDDQNIVLKIQFPGVKESIASDLEGVVRLLGLSMKKGSRALEQNAYTFAG
mgnify:CR=1 FL=1